MNKLLGKVIEVYIPEEYKNNEVIDVMSSSKIGFKIILDETNEIVDLVLEQDEDIADIFRDDKVVLIKDEDTAKLIKIELYVGEDYD